MLVFAVAKRCARRLRPRRSYRLRHEPDKFLIAGNAFLYGPILGPGVIRP